jgi:cytochrome c553
MKRLLAGLALSLLPAIALAAGAPVAAPTQLALPQEDWAYPEGSPDFQRTPAPDGPQRVPGSTRSLTRQQVGGMFNGIEDWFPERHGPMPRVVSHGREPAVRACAACHLTSGLGHASTGMSAGMNPDYFFNQVKELAAGLRNPRSGGMMRIAQAMTDAEIREAAAYYARQKPQKWVEVREAATVPVTWVQGGIDIRLPKPNAGSEPIGTRVIEIPADAARSELRDPYSGYVAYVPPGSIAKGRDLVTTGANGKTMACGVCHGPDLKGLGAVPGLAGRLPTYVARQMIDFRNKTRTGAMAPLMQPVVEKLTMEDVVNIVAYTASLDP